MITVNEKEIELIARYPLPGLAMPSSIKFAPGSMNVITFLASSHSTLKRELFAINLSEPHPKYCDKAFAILIPEFGDCESSLTLEEKLMRERMRDLSIGLTKYEWAPNADDFKNGKIIIPINGKIFIQDERNTDLRLIFNKITGNGSGSAISPTFSPNGQWVGFVQCGEVHIVAVAEDCDNLPTPITLTSRESKTYCTNGLAEFVAQEEMNRYDGFWWSKNSEYIAFCEVDESHIPKYTIPHSGELECFEEEV